MVLVSDLAHFLDVGHDAPGPAQRMAEHLYGIARAGTAAAAGSEWVSALGCRRRFCDGRLVIAHADQPARINWRCDHCDDEGILTGFENTPFDLRDRRRRVEPVSGDLVEVRVTQPVAAALRDLRLVDPDSERIIWSAASNGDTVLLCADSDQLDDLAASLAAEANHEPNRKRQRRLDDAFDTLNAALDTITP